MKIITVVEIANESNADIPFSVISDTAWLKIEGAIYSGLVHSAIFETWSCIYDQVRNS